MSILGYTKFNFLYKFISRFIDLLPLPNWITVETPYGVMLMPKSFRIITSKFGLVEPEVKEFVQEAMKEVDIFIDVGELWILYTYGLEISEARSGRFVNKQCFKSKIVSSGIERRRRVYRNHQVRP